MARRYTPKGPSVRTWFVCPLSNRDWKGTPPTLTTLPIILARDVEYAGKGKIRVVREYGPADIDDLGTWGAELRLRVAQLARVLGLVLERETVREVESEATRQKIARLEFTLARLADRAGAARPHRKRRRVRSRKVRGLGVQTRGFDGTEQRSQGVRPLGQRVDGLGPRSRPVIDGFTGFSFDHRPAGKVRTAAVTTRGKSEDGL
jgi:hypothetical protein